jgi:hypothetical protein
MNPWNEVLGHFNRRIMRLVSNSRNAPFFSELLTMGTILRDPEPLAPEIIERLGFPANKELIDFYQFSNGIYIPAMDAEDGFVRRVQDLLPWVLSSPSYSFPKAASDKNGLNAEKATKSIVLAGPIDSALYLWVPAEIPEFWTVFHHGEDMQFMTFKSLLTFELERVSQELENDD